MSQRVARSGAELVGLAEHFYAQAFAGTLAIVGLSATAALALLPVRDSVGDVGLTTPTVLLTVRAPDARRRDRSVAANAGAIASAC